MRYLFLVHRYLGITVSLLMVAWCCSGIVMLYVPYPRLAPSARLAALQPLDLSSCCGVEAAELQPGARIEQLRVEMMAGRMLADVQTQGGGHAIVDLESGKVVRNVDPMQAAAVAEGFARSRQLPAQFASVTQLTDDQWTVSGDFGRDRPLYKFAWRDANASELYVSSASGAAVQFTTGPLRIGNWFGSVPHWIYFTSLRRHPTAWARVVIVTSLLGSLLAAIGLFIGIHQYRHRAGHRVSPYGGLMWWHHVPGMVFGVFALTWVLSGLLSMNPWGLLQGRNSRSEEQRLSGALPRWSEVLEGLRKMGTGSSLKESVSLRSAVLGGRLVFIATAANGHRSRIDADGAPAPLLATDVAAESRALAAAANASLATLQHGDDYYYSRRGEPAVYPVYRVLIENADQTRYYLDAVSGEIVMKADRNARRYRWAHDALHRLDFVSALRSPSAAFGASLLLMGVLLVCATGCYAAMRRIGLWLA